MPRYSVEETTIKGIRKLTDKKRHFDRISVGRAMPFHSVPFCTKIKHACQRIGVEARRTCLPRLTVQLLSLAKVCSHRYFFEHHRRIVETTVFRATAIAHSSARVMLFAAPKPKLRLLCLAQYTGPCPNLTIISLSPGSICA